MPKASDLLIHEPMRGLAVINWAHEGLYESGCGPALGRMESVRVPKMTFEGGAPVCGILSRMPNDGLEDLICLEEPAMQALTEDEAFTAFRE